MVPRYLDMDMDTRVLVDVDVDRTREQITYPIIARITSLTDGQPDT